MSPTVSKIWAVCPGPGVLCARVPTGRASEVGEPAVASSVKASATLAATPGFNS